jgi:hypothetical protein
MNEAKALLLASLMVTAFMTGLIWFVQVVHYPGFQKVGESEFVPYHHFHTSATSLVVIAPMLLELGLAAYMILAAPQWMWWNVTSLVLVVLVWGITFFFIVPVHNQLEGGLDIPAVQQLVLLNLVRSFFWTGKLVVLAVLAFRELLN